MGGASRRPAIRSAAVAVGLAALFIVAGSFVVENQVPAGSVRPISPMDAFLDHIKHVVVVVMENHAFDTMYGAYCQTKGPYCPMTVAGLPPGTCVPYDPNNLSRGCIRPYPFSE